MKKRSILVRLEDIDINKTAPWNSRKAYPVNEAWDKFLGTIIRLGVTNPPSVIKSKNLPKEYRSDSVYRPVCGFRRLSAAKVACAEADGPDSVMCVEVIPDKGDDVVTILYCINLSENEDRDNLTPWELTEHLWSLHLRTGEPPAAVAKMVGRSESYVDNLIRMRRRIDGGLWEHYCKLTGRGLRVTINDMIALSKYEPVIQQERFNALVRGRKKYLKRTRKPDSANVREMLNSVGWVHRGMSEEWRRGARHALMAVVGDVRWDNAGPSTI